MNRIGSVPLAMYGLLLAFGASACGDDDGGGGGAGGGGGGPDLIELDPAEAAPAPSEHCIAVYDLAAASDLDSVTKVRDAPVDSANFDLPADASDTPTPSFEGELVLRLETSGGAILDGGVAHILYYRLSQEFVTTSFGVTVTTVVDAFAPNLGQTDNTIEVAAGTIDTDAANPHLLSFPDCELPAGYDDMVETYTPDVVATGVGCLAPYRSYGNVNCAEILPGGCIVGGLAVGDNPQDEIWEQPVRDITIANDLSTLDFVDPDPENDPTTDGDLDQYMQVPERNPVRTYMRWMGTLDAAASTCDDL